MNLINRVIVMVCQLLQGRNILSSKEHYMRNSFVCMIIKEILSIQIGRTAVVDESPHIAILCCIYSESTIPHHNFKGTGLRIRHEGRESIPKRAVTVVIPNVKQILIITGSLISFFLFKEFSYILTYKTS